MTAEDGFTWIDASLAEARSDGLFERLDLPAKARAALLNFDEDSPLSRKFHADGHCVVFAFNCWVEGDPLEVHVLVTGDYLLTLHAKEISLEDVLPTEAQPGRSEQYVVYTVLDAMVVSAYDALSDAEGMIEELQDASTDLRGGRVRMQSLRELTARLSGLRRRIGPQRGVFERISVEIGQVEGLGSDGERYFEHIGDQLNRLVDSIDAASDTLAKLIDLRLNETTYWLTVVATIFLPLTFITGFFGMNFGWMVHHIDTATAFVLLGIGGPILGVVLVLRLVVRGSPEG
jgi:magnesium transporter